MVHPPHEQGPPVAETRRVVHEAHGVKRTDDYAWLRDTSDPGVLAYLEAERAYYESQTADLAHLRTSLADELVGRTPAADSSISWRRGECVYYTRTHRGEEYERLYQIDTQAGTERELLDPNVVARAAGAAHLEVGVRLPSPDGTLLAWSVDLTGDEVYELRFRDAATGQDLPDVVPRSYYGGAWSVDGRHFFYTVHDETYRPHRVMRHVLGTDPAQDVVVVAEDDRRFELDVAASRDGGWVVVTAASRDTTEVHLVDARRPEETPRLVAPRSKGLQYRVSPLPGGWDGTGPDALLVVTDDSAPEFRLCWAPMPPPEGTGAGGSWVPVAAAVARDGSERLEAVDVLAEHVVLSLRRGAEPLLRVLPRIDRGGVQRSGFEVHPGVPHGQLALWRAEDWTARSVVVVEENLVMPPAWVEVDLDTGARRTLKRAQAPGVDLTAYATTRIEARAPDGTLVPVTIAHRRDVAPDGANPGLLYGYGAYEWPLWPSFELPVLSLLDRGVVYAIAHVRGGGERGRWWWEAGRLRSKQNTFTDFVAARDALVTSRWCAADAVACRGLSAGGLLQAAVYTQAPDRWAAVLAEVPFVDVVTTMSDPSIPLTVNEWDEWGDPAAGREDLLALLAYSPYDNAAALAGRTDLPDLLVTAALHDPRVLVHEPAKWVAALRAGCPQGAAGRVLLRVETGQGAHSGPSGRLAHLHYEAEVLAWVLRRIRPATAGAAASDP